MVSCCLICGFNVWVFNCIFSVGILRWERCNFFDFMDENLNIEPTTTFYSNIHFTYLTCNLNFSFLVWLPFLHTGTFSPTPTAEFLRSPPWGPRPAGWEPLQHPRPVSVHGAEITPVKSRCVESQNKQLDLGLQQNNNPITFSFLFIDLFSNEPFKYWLFLCTPTRSVLILSSESTYSAGEGWSLQSAVMLTLSYDVLACSGHDGLVFIIASSVQPSTAAWCLSRWARRTKKSARVEYGLRTSSASFHPIERFENILMMPDADVAAAAARSGFARRRRCHASWWFCIFTQLSSSLFLL